MNKDRIEGGARDAMGAVKSTAGRVVGDTRPQAEGLYDQVAGATQNAYGQAKDIAGDGAKKVADTVKGTIDRAKDAANTGELTRAARDAYGQARDVANQGANMVAGQVKASPLSSALTVGAVCFMIGWMMRRN